ncbi:DUF1648 domain-containing protein [Virgibacillus sp. NKC19-16]|uniref:DUF1648 domain-containing protein n=1 Tax=Virgibacillus salidurans TaxID=2831673 RepID=UPI001F170882|nr:DUF1648 domain-containing protein [Virgibacillus sp. NKC19-16]UJL45374.1 DUF1648 domain-containing protein [Virgibacillus sp. NKC19-16]
MKDQPNIKIPASTWENVFHLFAFILIITMFVYAIFMYSKLPDEVPIHFNAAGEADNWGGKGAIFMLPFISLPMFMLLFFLGRVPHTHNYPVKVTEQNAPKLYRESRLMLSVINFEVVAIFSLITWEMAQSAQGNGAMGIWMIVLVTVVPLATVGYFLLRMNRLKKEFIS